MDDVTNILHRTYEVYMRINTDRKSQRTTVGQKARQADHLAWSEDPPFLRELYSLFPKNFVLPYARSGSVDGEYGLFTVRPETGPCVRLKKTSDIRHHRWGPVGLIRNPELLTT
ncbi:hypothetical protein SFRURICE_007893 [Spodoptera frugiperda]|nr:hypothetical protein SFRURICE_007893 [Spodoptera frugiperda]